MKLVNLLLSKINKHRGGIKLYWWRGEKGRNFGDEVTPVIIEKIWGIKCRWTRLADCDVVGAGSILDIVRDYNPKGHKVTVWGSGFIEDGDSFKSDDVSIRLVRGPLTAGRLQGESNVQLGDPGLLASKVFPCSKTKSHAIGVIPHMKDLDTFRGEFAEDVLIISPYQSPEKVAADISSCETIFSSSLHGLIFADSYNIPNFRIAHESLEGGDYKFNDYYQSTGRNGGKLSLDEVKQVMSDETQLKSLIETYQPIKELIKIQATIIGSFPLKV